MAKINIPSKIFGIDSKEALERIMNEKEDENPPPQPQVGRVISTDIQNPENYIILPGKKHGSYEYPDVLISKVLEYQNSDWNQCKENLHNEDSFMLTIRQFADFLKMLKEGNSVRDGKNTLVSQSECLQIYNEITEVRDPYRAEWLDAKFSKQGNDFYINYHILRNNVLNPITEKLEDCIMADKQIDLEDYLANANSQGLPIPATKSGSLYFWFPKENVVARFRANSGRADLDCNWDPTDGDAGLGVRRAKKLAKNSGVNII